MKRIFNILLLFIGFGSSAFSQDSVSFEIYAGMQNHNLKTQIEKQTQALLTAINRAAFSRSKSIDFQGVKIDPSTQKTILMLWEYTHFKTVDSEIVEKCYEITTKGHVTSYHIRNIEVELIPLHNSSDKSLQEICVKFDKQGKIIDFTFAMDKQQTSRLLKEGEFLDDISKRMFIINFCEELKIAFLIKDISFINAVFSSENLIFLAPTNTKKETLKANGQEYLRQLQKIFSTKRNYEVDIKEIAIQVHSNKPQYYGVTLVINITGGKEKEYRDLERIFMVWDFADEDHPIMRFVCVQPKDTPESQFCNVYNLNLE